ncbi:hypothetical protein DYY67_0262 [Candidatus Nitrosotalea sp. TS]|uniref:hypothetical protein n=1 Tax=Candidatus Nitrosotalea sp. TS TaxID=2341020 RepID=UPI00140D4BED|nr:hypothetical protein [Candidatus Nitrosotalea sp. TS]NHI03141.1 hypothetical protein [Candidatus Nitrosotalea sp. TS]
MTNPAWAEGNATQSALTSMFNEGNIQTNTYNDPTYSFSILPPHGWIPVSQSNQSDSALVEFANENQNGEATFAIYFYQGKPIDDAVLATPDNQILDLAIAKLFDTSKYVVYQKNIQRFSDGFVIQAVVAQNQTTTQNSPVTEEFSFWLKDGRQYFLVMVSSQKGFYQNAADFERSVYTFYVGPQPTANTQIPEWVKNDAKMWSEGAINDQTFASGIQYMIKNGIIVVPSTVSSASQSQQIPSWIKNSAGWWASGQISDNDFVKGIQYLINNGIISVG